MPAGNRRGTFAATPAGKAGAPGTPDISASTNPGIGSGSGKNREGVPSGLIVGAGPDGQNRSAVAGQGQGNGTGGGTGTRSSDNSRLMADATPPRVSSTPPHSLSEVSPAKLPT